LSAHLLRGGGVLIATGSAGFAKYNALRHTLHIRQKAWELRKSEGDLKGRAQ